MGLVAFVCPHLEAEVVHGEAAYVSPLTPEQRHEAELDIHGAIGEPQSRAITTGGAMPFNNSAMVMQQITAARQWGDTLYPGTPPVLRASIPK